MEDQKPIDSLLPKLNEFTTGYLLITTDEHGIFDLNMNTDSEKDYLGFLLWSKMHIEGMIMQQQIQAHKEVADEGQDED